MERKILTQEQILEIRKLKLPANWKVKKIEVEFEREGTLKDWARVEWDALSGTFMTHTNKATVYPGDEKALLEAIEIMQQANKLLPHP